MSALVVAAMAADRPLAAQSPASVPGAADSLAYRHRLLGVFDGRTGDAIENAEVRDLYSGTTALTTKTGTVSLAFLPAGRTLVGIRRLGYVPRTLVISIAPNDTAALTLLLAPQPTTLPTVTTTDSSTLGLPPVLRDFEERKRTGLGRYIDEARLRANDGHSMSFVLATLPGLAMRSGRVVGTHGTSPGPVILSSGEPCYATVYQDGAVIFQSGLSLGKRSAADMPPDFGRIGVDQYEAVEFYASAGEYPPSISPTNNPCGVLMLWTRSR